MAKVGNEAHLILSLAEAEVKLDGQLAKETKFYFGMTGNQNLVERTAKEEWFKMGYNLGVQVYKDTLAGIVRKQESR